MTNTFSRKHSSSQKHFFPVNIWPAFDSGRILFNFKEISEPGSQRPSIDELPKLPFVESPTIPFTEIFDLPTLNKEQIRDPADDEKEPVFMSSLIKIRRRKMNKHKYKKRIDRDIAKIRKIRTFRMRKKRRRQIHKRKALVKKLAKVLKQNPKSDLPNRPYVMYRLKNW